MSIERTNNHIFSWASNLHCKNWVTCIKELLHQCNLHDYIDADLIDKGPLLQAIEEGIENIVEKWLGIIRKEGSKRRQR